MVKRLSAVILFIFIVIVSLLNPFCETNRGFLKSNLYYDSLHELSNKVNRIARDPNSSFPGSNTPFEKVKKIVSKDLTAEDILSTVDQESINNKKLLEFREELLDIIQLYETGKVDLNKFTKIMTGFSERINHLNVEEQEEVYNTILIAKSVLAKKAAPKYLKDQNDDELLVLKQKAITSMEKFIEEKIERREMNEDAREKFKTAKKLIDEWINEPKIPSFIKQGIVRAMLEGRNDDLIFAFGEGWREFGTAGIRNQAVNSSYLPVQLLELEEFAQNSHAPILTGPNTINSITLLQQTATVKEIFSTFRNYLKENKDADSVSVKELMQYSELYNKVLKQGKKPEITERKIDLTPEFKQDLLNNKVTIAYDSRLNGRHLAYMLAADFLNSGTKVDLFDNVAGMPALVHATSEMDSENSTFGFLISASHSESNYNGFKFVVGYKKSQVDSSFQKMIMAFRNLIEYEDISLELANQDSFSQIMKENSSDLTWLGTGERHEKVNYFGGDVENLYSAYYKYVKKRSPLSMVDSGKKIEDVKEGLQILYTAFSGAGADDAGGFKEFMGEMGYDQVETIESQTAHVNGRFPAFINNWGLTQPDPGDISGMVKNLVNYLIQEGGVNLRSISHAIEKLNSKELILATDPDIDRASMIIDLPNGVEGNIKGRLIKETENYIVEKVNINEEEKKELESKVIITMEEELNDKLLLTANDAWMFMNYSILKMLENEGKLEKNELNLILKSHVTTPGLNNIAKFYSNKGYNVDCVNTFVGFTKLAEKAEQLFNFAKVAWKTTNYGAKNMSIEESLSHITSNLSELEKVYRPIVGQVKVIDETMELIEEVSKEPRKSKVEKVLNKLSLVAHMNILSGVEESNGYGEFGRVRTRDGKPAEVVGEHMKEKDGSLAAYKFTEIYSYLKSKGKSLYKEYLKMFQDIGVIPATFNNWTKYKGANGEEQKNTSIESLEKLLAYAVLKDIDHNKKVTFFDEYKLNTDNPVTIYWSHKYDNKFRRYPNAGIRFKFNREYKGSTYQVIVTYRPSGTGMKNRDYNWAVAVVPEDVKSTTGVAQIEKLRQEVDEVLSQQKSVFFGKQMEEIENSNEKDTHGLLIELKEKNKEKYGKVFAEVLGRAKLGLTEKEGELYENAIDFAHAAHELKGKVSSEEREDWKNSLEAEKIKNRRLWESYLQSSEAKNYPNKVDITVGDETLKVPRAMAISWTASLADYILGFMEERGLAVENVEIKTEVPHLPQLVKLLSGYDIKESLLKPE